MFLFLSRKTQNKIVGAVRYLRVLKNADNRYPTVDELLHNEVLEEALQGEDIDIELNDVKKVSLLFISVPTYVTCIDCF